MKSILHGTRTHKSFLQARSTGISKRARDGRLNRFRRLIFNHQLSHQSVFLHG